MGLASLCFSLVLFRHSLEDIEPLLASISAMSQYSDEISINLYIYDGSPSSFCSPTYSQIKSRFPCLKCSLENGPNVGFGSANNINFARAGLASCDLFCVVNPDIKFKAHQLLPLIRWTLSTSNVSCAAPLILQDNGSIQFSVKHNPTILSLLLGRFEWLLRFSFLREYDVWHRNLDRDYSQEIIFSQYLSGCFLLIPAWAFDAVGGFCRRYFLHVEDADLVRRLSAVGLSVHNPVGIVVHGWARGSHSSVRQIICLLKSYFNYCLIWGLRVI